MHSSRFIYLVIAAAILVVAALALTGCCRQAAQPLTSPYGREGISVSGTAVVRTAPDIATVQLGYESRARKARPAKLANDAVMRRMLAALKAEGIARKDIQTVEYRLFPIWQHDPPAPRVLTWHVLNMVEVRVRKVETVADVIDAASAAGADKVGDVVFSLDSLHKQRAKARELAVKVAREKAEQLAKEMGVKLGRVVSITDNSYNYYGDWGYGWRRGNVNANAQVSFDAPTAVEGQPESVINGGQIAVQAREEVIFAIE